MKLEINLKRDLKKLNRELGELKAKHLPYAISKSVNELVLEARWIMRDEFERELAIRKKTLLNKAIQVNFSSKGQFPHIEAEVGIMVDFEFLAHHVTGEQRKALSTHGKAIPVEVQRGKNGAIASRMKPKEILKRKNVFKLDTVNGPVIAQRVGKERYPIKILYGFKKSVKIVDNVYFQSAIDNMVNSRFDKVLGDNLAKAIRSAK